jgi:2-amino-4-hydroxy-6-hydroxymethyldihydropteridine diphosphokinase
MKGKYLLLGSNVGDREKHLREAREKVVRHIGAVVRESSVYLTEPWGFQKQTPFYNQILQIHTDLGPHEVLHTILHIEKELGRLRTGKWKERIIDIDILYYEDEIINDAQLTIPHPGIPDRRFVLEPLCEIIPDAIHPALNVSNRYLLSHTNDPLRVEKISFQDDPD